MGKIKKILENELVGGTQTTDVYPVTSVKAVYDESNERLDHILARRGVVNVSTNYNNDHVAEILTLSQAIAKVPSSDRVLGFTMTFLSSNGWKTYQFTGNLISNWSDTTKWDPVLHSSEVLQELGDSKTAPVSQKVVKDAVIKTTKDSRFKETIEVVVPAGASNAIVTILKYTESGGKLYFTIDNSNFPSNISYLGTKIRDDDNVEITTFGNVTNHTLNSFESRYFNIGCYFSSKVPRDIHIPIKVVYEQRYETYDKEISQVKSLVDSTLKGKISNVVTIKNGSKSAGIKINQALTTGYKLRFTVDKSNFPQDISYIGAQIRDDNNKEITTRGDNIFEINSFNTTNIDVAFYFKSQLSKSIDIPFTIDILTYTRQIIENNVDGLIPAGVSTKRFENFKDFYIYGYGSSVSILEDKSGNYDTPPIEIAGGGISNITVREDGEITDHQAYCVHIDSDNAKGKTLKVDNCHFINNLSACWGVGTRNGYTIEFKNCVFERAFDNRDELSGICWYSHNTTVVGNIPSLDDKSKIIFIGCTFISAKKYCMRLQDWIGTSDYCEWTFINCTFICASANIDDTVYIEYKGYPDELGVKKFKHKFSLSEKSCGNNVSWLNYNN